MGNSPAGSIKLDSKTQELLKASTTNYKNPEIIQIISSRFAYLHVKTHPLRE